MRNPNFTKLVLNLISYQSTEILGVYFAPESGSDADDTNGKLALGGAGPPK